MPILPDSRPPAKNHHNPQTLSQAFRAAQLRGEAMTLTKRADMTRRIENPARIYGDRGAFGLRRW